MRTGKEDLAITKMQLYITVNYVYNKCPINALNSCGPFVCL